MSGERLLTLNEAAERLGMKSHWALRRWCTRGKIPYCRLNGRTIRILESDLDALIAASRVEAHEALALPGVEPEADDGDEA